MARERLLGDLLGAVLASRQYTPVIETSARLALDHFVAEALTIVDLASLGQEGLDLIADLRLTDVNAAIVAVIGRGTSMLESTVYSLGVTDILRRDDDMSQMLDLVDGLSRDAHDERAPATSRIRRGPSLSPDMPVLDEPTTVLVADDDESVRQLLERVLMRNGYRVLTASDGAQAMQILDGEAKVHLLFLDLRMPRLGGLAVLRWMRDKASPPRIVIVSASTDRDLKLETITLGAFDYLEKPNSVDRLLVTASAVMVLERSRSNSVWKQWARRFR